jgi:hypothetical protein
MRTAPTATSSGTIADAATLLPLRVQSPPVAAS